MTKDSIRFTILNKDNIPVDLTATIGEDGQLYRCGSPIHCNCTNNPVPYLYLDGEVYCPNCGKKSLQVETFTEAISNIHLDFLGTDYNTMQDLYKLSDTLPYSTWNMIADLFAKLTPVDVDLGYTVNYVGWVTSNPEAVEERLNIREELRVRNGEKIEPLPNEASRLSETETFDIIDKLHELFSVVETPYGEFQLFNPKGFHDYVVPNPLFPPNQRVGNGEFWYVKQDDLEIWYVRYNFMEGADLRMNNVLIDFELKAIGKMIPYDEDVVELIRKLER